MTTATPAGARSGPYRYATLDLLTIAVISAVGGVVSAYVVIPWAKFIEGAIGPFGAALNNGFFILWAILAGLILRKPGIAFVTSMLTGTIELLAGSLDGSIVLVFVAFQGIGMELGLAAFRYRPGLPAAWLSGALGGVGCAVCILYVFGFAQLAVPVQILFIAALALGDAVLGGSLAYAIAKSLERLGVAQGTSMRPGRTA
jgi:energy-coupling factor transport system substrate-specific component